MPMVASTLQDIETLKMTITIIKGSGLSHMLFRDPGLSNSRAIFTNSRAIFSESPARPPEPISSSFTPNESDIM